MASATLSRRALNRALLARQWLLTRQRRTATAAVEHLVGMHAQVPANVYVAMWSRLEGFTPAPLSKLLTTRKALRMTLLRGTLHLVSAADARAVRPLVQPVIDRMYWTGSGYGKRIRDVEPAALVAAGRAILDEQPRPTAALAEALRARFPAHDAMSLAQGVRALLPLVQITPRGVWGASHQATWATVDRWLDGVAAPAPLSLDALVRRYLAAFGPASINDMQSWSGLTRLREVFTRLRDELVTFRCPRGRELFDLPRAPRPDEDTAAPPRFLPEYDNLLLGHDDRSRMGTEEVAARIDAAVTGNRVLGRGYLLLDGEVAALWKVDGNTLEVEPMRRLRAADRPAIVDEGERLLAFATGGAARTSVRFRRA